MNRYSELLNKSFIDNLIKFRENSNEDIFLKKSVRESFSKGVLSAVEKNPRVVALSADLSDSVGLTKLRTEKPDNYIEVGIAEQNLVSVAAGMAHVGLKPFAFSYAAFNPGRNYEQIRTNIALNNVPVVVVGSHAGVNVGPDGATHQMLEDIAMMRALPNMKVFAPADNIESFAMAEVLADSDFPAYVRLPRENMPEIFANNADFSEFKKPLILRNGVDVALVGYGSMTSKNLMAAEILSQDGVEVSVIHFPQISTFSSDIFCNVFSKIKTVLVSEEHEKNGGFGDEIAAMLLENGLSPNFVRVAIDNKFGQSGTVDELNEFYGISAINIARKIRETIK